MCLHTDRKQVLRIESKYYKINVMFSQIPNNYISGMQSKTAELACEQAHWEKGELARNHAFYSLSASTGIINKAVNCQIDAGRGMYNEEMYKTNVTPRHFLIPWTGGAFASQGPYLCPTTGEKNDLLPQSQSPMTCIESKLTLKRSCW